MLNDILAIKKRRILKKKKNLADVETQKQQAFIDLDTYQRRLTSNIQVYKNFCDNLTSIEFISLFEYRKKQADFEYDMKQLILEKKECENNICVLSKNINSLTEDIKKINISIEKIKYVLNDE
ncbi:hypothetical protein [Edwardsiella anguillarum]|uniref:hypothetical protein n=1 Tax=Edwardsiella anguillarum TaxID=1821960 RepID=UPI000E348098|nr:hypothetical protein [Edwardsiella anguillarum]RFT03410.1 hypothetical protein CGL57_11965 [Edwardsiella anguillarum]